ncbi:hypothetical protein BP5796_13240 [Coleophoma crateriformis]|uniref:Uncharacterized protein n=1 Tax=Coleophoma crateriformis TaxID=565419 RepID=A0A3D8Q373_9HELO|nr:hypothetical protein BP5796_13240 [Coleophoma crateriformis]
MSATENNSTAASIAADVNQLDGVITADTNDDDSSYETDDTQSDTTSIASSMYRGYIENGRRYQTLRDQYWGPADELQFETMEAGHLLYTILDSGEENQLFRSPIGDNPQMIIWILTAYQATINGVDLYPPPATWVPPNCIFEVDDVTRDWTWGTPFDLIHLRMMIASFTPPEWDSVYTKAFNNLKPGGWIEQLETDIRVQCSDDSLPEDSLLSGWAETFFGCGDRAGRPLDIQSTMKASMEKAGFVDVHEKVYQIPIGTWPKLNIYKDAGRVNRQQWKSGLDGWVLFLLTKFGAPTPWSPEEVLVYTAKVRAELMNPKYHTYHHARRVWAKKPE